MRLTKANAKAIRYAILNWHYSKSVPSISLGYNVYNGDDEWCGVICYGRGANNNIAKSFDMNQGEVVELVRVALNGKQEVTSKAVAISLKLLHKDAPQIKIVVSYADLTNQGHKGVIYKASNWICLGEMRCYAKGAYYLVKGKKTHGRSVREKYGRSSLGYPDFIENYDKEQIKIKYIYILDKLCESSLRQNGIIPDNDGVSNRPTRSIKID